MVPPEDGKYELTYVLDCLREEKIVDGKKYIELGITVSSLKKNTKKNGKHGKPENARPVMTLLTRNLEKPMQYI